MTRFLARYKLSAIWVGCVAYCLYVYAIWDLTR